MSLSNGLILFLIYNRTEGLKGDGVWEFQLVLCRESSTQRRRQSSFPQEYALTGDVEETTEEEKGKGTERVPSLRNVEQIRATCALHLCNVALTLRREKVSGNSTEEGNRGQSRQLRR
ncbi:hypothetical protein INR49_004528, partial [Caranx melampygus]